jgi:spermidine/putrescine transport system permease protein
LAFPIAYFLAFRAGDRATLYLLLLLVPFAVSYLLRVMAWRLMLGGEGAINSFLQFLGLTSEPLDLLLYSRPAVVITLVYVWIPFAALPIYAALQRIDRGHLEAAADLGAGAWSRFLRVTLPMSAPGVLAAFFMVFIPTVGEYVTPALVGGTEGYMYGNLVQDFFTRAASWATGAALSVIMLVVTLAFVAVALRVVQSDAGPARPGLRRHARPPLLPGRAPVRLLVQCEHEPRLPVARVHARLVRRGAG